MNDEPRVEQTVGSKRKRSPLTVWTDLVWESQLRGTVKSVATALGRHMDTQTLVAYPSMGTLATLAGVDRNTVKTAIKALRTAGLLEWETGARRPGGRQKANTYQGIIPNSRGQLLVSKDGPPNDSRGQLLASTRGQKGPIQRPATSQELRGLPKGSPELGKDLRETQSANAPASGDDSDWWEAYRDLYQPETRAEFSKEQLPTHAGLPPNERAPFNGALIGPSDQPTKGPAGNLEVLKADSSRKPIDPEIAAECERMIDWIANSKPIVQKWLGENWPTDIPSIDRPDLHTSNTLEFVAAYFDRAILERLDGKAPSPGDLYSWNPLLFAV